jgi:hypothetical protein
MEKGRYREYEVKIGDYQEISESSIRIPEDIKLIRSTDELSDSGLYNFLGVTQYDYNELQDECQGRSIGIYKFPGYCLITIRGIEFIDDAPEIIEVEEFNKLQDFTKDYIVHYTNEFRIKVMYKILWIESELNIKVSYVSNLAWYSEDKILKQIGETDITLRNLDPRYCIAKIVSGELADKYWDTLLGEVLDRFGIEYKPSERVNINLAHETFRKEEFSKLDNIVNMTSYE